MINTKIQAR